MKAFVVSIVLHLVILGVIYLKGGFEPVESRAVQATQEEQAVRAPMPKEESIEIKESKNKVLNDQEKKDLIVSKLKAQEKQANRMTPTQKHRALDSQLSQLDGVDGGVLELLTLEVLKLTDTGSGEKELVEETASVNKKIFDHNSSFFTDVIRTPKGIKVSMEDKFGNQSSYLIAKEDVTEDDLALLKLYEKSKNNKHLKIILDSFLKHYQGK
jgi:hypothetical protein